MAAIAAIVIAGAASGGPATRAVAASGPCLGTAPGTPIPITPGPPLRFGVTPGATAGQIGPSAPAKPESASATIAALRALAPSPLAFVLRLNRIFWSEGDAGLDRFLALAHAYSAAGFQIELQLRYKPPAGHSDDIAGWVAFVREAVRRFGADPAVVGAQVTNEVNFTASPDSSDGANAGAKDALIAGVIAAKQEATELGYAGFRVGFNWFYRTDPSSEQAFWTYLGQHGGPAFAAAVDWVGLDAYPGTFFPPVDTQGGERDAIANALSAMRCYMDSAALGRRIPIYVEENGYPTGPGRSADMQRQVLETMVEAFNDFRGFYNVSDYRWFDLRDADSSSVNFQQQFGLLRDDYSAKPAFDAYRRLVAADGARLRPFGAVSPGSAPRRPRLQLLVAGRRGSAPRRGCLAPPLRARLAGPDSGRVARARFLLDGRRLHGASRGRLAQTITLRLLRRRRQRVEAHVLLRGGVVVDLEARPFRACR